MKIISSNRTRSLLLILVCLTSIGLVGSPGFSRSGNKMAVTAIPDVHYSSELSQKSLINPQNGKLSLSTSALGENLSLFSNRLDPPPPRERIDFSAEVHPNITQVYTNLTTSEYAAINALAVADFNTDGTPDFVAGADNTYFFNGATGEILYQNPEWTKVLAVADFNNDGVDDVAAVTIWDYIYFLDGTSGEILYNNTEPTDTVRTLALADFTNDGIPDVCAGSWDTNVYFIDGTSGETLYINTEPTGWVDFLGVGDFSQDGIPDIAAGAKDEIIYFIDGASGETLYTNSDPELMLTALVVTDFNQDSIPDVVAGGWTGIYFINGASGETLYHSPGSIHSLTVGDFNNDSIPDIVAGSRNALLGINGASGETLWTNVEPRATVVTLAVADFNQDSIPDIVAGSEDHNVYRVNGATGETLWTNTEPEDTITALEVADFNQDSLPDVVVASKDANIYVLVSDHTGPILQYCLLPLIPTSMKPLDCQLVFNEPNIDTIWMWYYSSDGEINFIAPSDSTANIMYFTLPSVQKSPLEFWFWANDTWGNVRTQGRADNSYKLAIFLQQPWTNTEPVYDVDALAVADFNQDTIPDIAAGAEDIYFIDGASGETLYQSSVWGRTPAIGDFNTDGIPDIAVSSFEDIYFIDGASGETLYINTDAEDSVRALVAADFNQDSIPDVAAGSWDTNIYFIDGASGETLYINTEPTDWVGSLVIGDFNQDSIPDVAAGTHEWDTSIYFIDGASGESFRTNVEPIDVIHTLDVGDFNQDSIPDVVAGAIEGEIYFIDGATGKTLYKNIDPTKADWWVQAQKVGDFNNDSIPDVVVGSRDGNVYLINGATGKTIFTTQVLGAIEGDQLALGDVTRDGIPDVIVATINPESLYIIDGWTGKTKETLSLEFGVFTTSNLLVADFDQNGFLDIVMGQSIRGQPTKQIAMIQPLSPVYDLVPSLHPQLVTLAQGERSNFSVELRDVFGRGVANSTVMFLAKKVDTGTFATYLGKDLGNGSYSFSLSTADWQVGEWQFYLVTSDPLHNDIELADYVDSKGNWLPPSKIIRVRGDILPEFILSSETGPFANGSRVVESSNITLQVNLKDAYYHALSHEEATVLVSFMGPHVPAKYEQGRFVTELSTRGLSHGRYQIGITIWGPYLNKVQRVLIVEVIPRFPTMDFSPLSILIVAGVAFLILLLFMRGIAGIHESLRTSPESALKTSKRLRYAVTIFFLGTLGGGTVLFFINPVLSFLVILVAFGEILLLYFLWFFNLIYTRITNFEEELFSIKVWWSTIIFSGLVAFPMALSLLIGGQIDWFNYYMRQELTDLILITIPSIYWEIGIVSFASGFLLVILNAIYAMKKDTERLKEKKGEVELEYKDPSNKLESVLSTEIASISSSSFSSLLRSFFIWYLIVLYTFFVTFQLYNYLQLVVSVSVPVVSTLVIAVRKQLRDLLRRR